MTPKPKRVEAVKAWGYESALDGKLHVEVSRERTSCQGWCRVRIIREADYQRLLKAANAAKLTK